MNPIVVGAYQTRFGELWDKSLEDLIKEAVFGAIKDSKVSKNKIQACFLGNKLGPETTDQNHLASLLAEILQINIPVVRVEAACASGGVAFCQAFQSVKSGQYDLVLAAGAEKMTDVGGEAIAAALMGAASADERNAGLTFPGLYALMAQDYFAKFGIGEKELAQVAIKNHYHGSLNPKAQFRFPLTAEQVLQSSLVAWPLKLLDCSPVTDGAAAVLVANPRILGKPGKKYPQIIASVQASDTLSLAKRQNLSSLKATQIAGKKAFRQAGIGRQEVDILEVHDCFTIAEILALEDLGFYPPGQASKKSNLAASKLGGKRPVNLSGGLKACGHPVGATGVKQVVEIYHQLMGRAGPRQQKNCRIGLTHNVGGTGGTVVVNIFKV